MNDPTEAKSSPEVKPWVRRVVAAAGVVLPATLDGAIGVASQRAVARILLLV